MTIRKTKSTPAIPKTVDWSIGERIPEYDFPVLNERAVRAAAGLLFLVGFTAWLNAWHTGDYRPMQAFGILFALDMFMRLFAGPRFSPFMFLGKLLTCNQRPEWVDAKPKQVAWTLGLILVIISCFSLGWLGMTGLVPLLLCGICLTLLFAEAAIGFCLGCELARRFGKAKPHLCAGDVCQYQPPKKQGTRN